MPTLAATCVACVAACLAVGNAARGDSQPVGTAQAEAIALLAAVPAGDVVVFEAPRGSAPRLTLAARVKAEPARVIAMLADPAAYQRAIPAFVRAETIRTEAPKTGGPAARLLAWELEIPLWNLEGRLWLRPQADGADLDLIEGDMAPGRFALRVRADGTTTVLTLEGAADVKDANWITRRLARRDPLAEPAMAATASYVLLRALVLEAERRGPAPALQRWPHEAARAPAPENLDGHTLAAALARLGSTSRPEGSAVALVTSRADGRLAQIALAVWPRSNAALGARLADPARWRSLPGWSRIEIGSNPTGVVWDVDANLPFVDFDALWNLTSLAPFRAVARGGDWQGAVMGWDLPGSTPGAGAVFTLHPRLETTGYIPRRLIEAEPLLEHGLALGLAYVDAVSLMRALQR